MKHHVSPMHRSRRENPRHPHTRPRAYAAHADDWVSAHPRVAAILLTGVITGLFFGLLSAVQLNLTFGMWPLFG